MEFQLKVQRTAHGGFRFTIRLLSCYKNILKPAQPVQCAKIPGNSHQVEPLARMNRQSRFRGFRCNATKSYEIDLIDNTTRRQPIGCADSDCSLGIDFLRARAGPCDNEQPKKRNAYRSSSAHLSLHQENN